MTVMLIASGRPPFADDPAKACRDQDPELWWPPERLNNALRGAQAKAICRTCPLQRDCLTWAVETRQDWGIWGGHDEKQRRDIRRTDHCRDTGCGTCTPKEPT